MAKSFDKARLRVLTGAAAIAVATAIAASPAFAADAAQQATGTESSPPATSGVQEIVVTAQHRSENLQKVPVSISAVTAATLASTGVDASSTLPQVVPSVQFTRSGPSGLFFMRGVGQTNAAQGEEGSNAVYVDGVYMADLGQAVNYFNNIERIEVLKGPQGTLFGRNATGGLINIVTRDPSDELTAKGQFGYGNYQTLEEQLYVSTPIGESAGVDLALTHRYQGQGWEKNITNGQDDGLQNYWGARSKAVIKPATGVKLTIAGDYFHANDSTNLDYDLWPGQVGFGGYTTVPGRNVQSDIMPATHQRIWGISGTADISLGDFATLTSITAYRKNHTSSLIDFDAGPYNLLTVALDGFTTSFQQEVRIVSKETEPFAWQIGGFYLRSKATNVQSQTGGLFAPLGFAGTFIDDAQVTKSYAAFGEATYAITPTTHVTGGLRYTMDRKQFEGGSQIIALSGALGPVATQPNPHLRYNTFTYRAAIRQDITNDINLYASFNRGFKAGLFNLQGPTNAPVKPQYINAYEGGIKTQLFDHKLRLNLSGYHYDINNLQIRSGLSGSPGTSILLNAAKVKVNGGELEFDAAPTRDLHLFGGINVMSSKFSRFDLAPHVVPNPADCATLKQTGPATGGLATCFASAKGNYTPLAPKFTASIGAGYTIPLQGDMQLRLNALYSYNSGYYFEPDNVYKQKAFSQVNGSIDFDFTKNWTLEVWGKNIGNKAYFVTGLSSAVGTDTVYAPPRTYGVTVKFNY